MSHINISQPHPTPLAHASCLFTETFVEMFTLLLHCYQQYLCSGVKVPHGGLERHRHSSVMSSAALIVCNEMYLIDSSLFSSLLVGGQAAAHRPFVSDFEEPGFHSSTKSCS